MKTAAIESTYAWWRLAASLALTTIGSAGMFAVVVALPAFESEFAIARAGASVPYTMIMAGFGIGGLLAGPVVDRYGIVMPLAVSAVLLGLAWAQAAWAPNLFWLSVAHVQIGCFGCATVFAPLIADISKWFNRRRGLAVAICASGNYVSGALWPSLMQQLITDVGWRNTYLIFGIASVALMLPMLLLLNRRPVGDNQVVGDGGSAGTPAMLGLTPNQLLALLCVAGFGCCMAMAMPQVHLISYCVDLGFGAVAGAEMLSLMLLAGVASRIASGFVADWLGGVKTLLISSSLQCVALFFYLPFDGLVSLYVVSVIFGLSQGGIVPSYAIIVREFLPPKEAGARIGAVILATIAGMALGGWVSGWIYDVTRSYEAAFLNGIAWNMLNIAIIMFVFLRGRPARAALA